MENAETDCRAVIAKLYEYLDGEIAGEVCSAIQSHLSVCVDCHHRADFEREFKYVVKTRCSESAPQEVLSRIRAAIERFESA